MLRTSAVSLTLLLVFAGPLLAHESESPLQVVDELAAIIQDDDASWNDKWAAYKAAKEAIAAEKTGDSEAKPAAARYEEIQGDVATALRRDNLPVSGWIMGFFAASLLWGGFAVCLAIARKSGPPAGAGGE